MAKQLPDFNCIDQAVSATRFLCQQFLYVSVNKEDFTLKEMTISIRILPVMVSDTSSNNLSLGVVKKAFLLGVILMVADAPKGG